MELAHAPVELVVNTRDLGARVSVTAVSASRGSEAVLGAEAPARSVGLRLGCRRGHRNDRQGGDEQNECAKHGVG